MYHGRMMNIPATRAPAPDDEVRRVYLIGHRDARHAAAEIANEADAELARLRAENDRLQTELSSAKVAAFGGEVGQAHLGTLVDELRAELASVTAERDALLSLRNLVMHETGEDAEGLMPHEPREALKILRDAARAAGDAPKREQCLPPCPLHICAMLAPAGMCAVQDAARAAGGGGQQTIEPGDEVHHGPTGENWVVLHVEDGVLYNAGWPTHGARLSDCELIRKGRPEQAQYMREAWQRRKAGGGA